jgi:hypothetical protein
MFALLRLLIGNDMSMLHATHGNPANMPFIEIAVQNHVGAVFVNLLKENATDSSKTDAKPEVGSFRFIPFLD